MVSLRYAAALSVLTSSVSAANVEQKTQDTPIQKVVQLLNGMVA